MDTIRLEDTIDLSNPESQDLRKFLAAQNVGLKPNELARIRELFGRNPTLVELHIFNIMWSEHCSYKSSRKVLKKYLPTESPDVVLGPGEDAGIVRVCRRNGTSYCLVMGHESHNHPSQVLPVEGAATGIGGIVRDVYCMGADVIGVLDPLRFGDPDGPNAKRVREIVRGVVDGIAQYGNALGVPNHGGDTFFDKTYDDNCLVNVVALGIVAEEDVIRSRAPDAAKRSPHDIILIGKPTDASGFGGAAFASERLSGDQEKERQEAV
jgi:phosphoribosylformylglycinamidine synthase